MKGYKKALVASLATIGVSSVLIGGATLALFSSDSTTNIAVTSGKVSVVAEIDANSLTTYSYEVLGDENTQVEGTGTFVNGGTATIEENKLTIEDITPGDKVEFEIQITNYSTVDIQYITKVTYSGDYGFYKMLDIKFDGGISEWTKLEAGVDPAPVTVSVELPEEATNEYQEKSISLYFTVEAKQGNAKVEKPSFDLPASGDAAENGNALLDALNNAETGDEIIVPYAEYEFAEARTEINTGNITIKGMPDIYGNNPVLKNAITVSGDNVTLKNLSIEAEGSATEGQYTLNVTGGNFIMDGCEVRRSSATAPAYGMVLAVKATEGVVTITNSTFVAPCGGNAGDISAVCPSVIESDVELKMTDCVIATNGYGLFAQHVKNAELKNVKFCGLDGYYDGIDVEVKTLYMAINSTYIENIVLDGCTITDTRSWGILAAGDSLTITDSKFENVRSRQISFSYGTIKNVVITNNTFDLSTGYGIKFDNGSLTADSEVTIDNNTFKNLADNADNENYVITNLTPYTIKATNCIFENHNEEYAENENVEIDGKMFIYKHVSTSEEFIEILNQFKTTQPEHPVYIKLAANTTFEATANEQFRLEANDVHIIGAEGTVIDAGAYVCSGQAAFEVSGDNCSIENVTIQAAATSANVSKVSDVAVLKITELNNENDIVENFTLKNVTLNGTSDMGHGLNLHGVDKVTVEGLKVESYGKCAISLAKATNVKLSGIATAKMGWADIGYMYGKNPDQEKSYKTHCANISLDLTGSSLGNGTIYSERPTDSWDKNADELISITGEGSEDWVSSTSADGTWGYARKA